MRVDRPLRRRLGRALGGDATDPKVLCLTVNEPFTRLEKERMKALDSRLGHRADLRLGKP